MGKQRTRLGIWKESQLCFPSYFLWGERVTHVYISIKYKIFKVRFIHLQAKNRSACKVNAMSPKICVERKLF